MEILKRPDELTIDFTCECGCEFLAENSEYDVLAERLDGDAIVSAECPACGGKCIESVAR